MAEKLAVAGASRNRHFHKVASFRKARARAQITDLHFHDARHTAIGKLAQRLHVLDLARVTGHRDLRMLDRYYHATAEVLAERIG